ncbi:hypothetical protein JOL79_16345 [Microbispora sp. RL4-1S]|uniref:YCII-related domain-containing protein n=1 Tax=Microbispora oryzae TaxID=2806554 RepID=A0A941AIP5_9ACTN|nr:YciI family protein [Microbispora oryzae]MBP2705386.1 hypothetical protein [Microbispora oryzae]
MTQYALLVHQPGGEPPPPDVLDPIIRDVGAVDQAMRDAGVWVFTARLHSDETATVVRAKDGEALMTDGPYAEGKEYLGGFTVIDVPDLDAALDWARRLALAIRFLPIEVRPVQGGAGG